MNLDPGRREIPRGSNRNSGPFASAVCAADPQFARNSSSDRDLERASGSPSWRKGFAGPISPAFDRVALPRDAMGFTAVVCSPRSGRVCSRKRPLRAAEIGNAHPRKLHAAELLRREGDGHPQDAEKIRCRPRICQKGMLLRSRRMPAFQGPCGTCPGRCAVVAAGSRPNSASGGSVSRGEEIEDIVLARVHPRLERGPGDRRNRRDGRGQRLEAALLAQIARFGSLPRRASFSVRP